MSLHQGKKRGAGRFTVPLVLIGIWLTIVFVSNRYYFQTFLPSANIPSPQEQQAKEQRLEEHERTSSSELPESAKIAISELDETTSTGSEEENSAATTPSSSQSSDIAILLHLLNLPQSSEETESSSVTLFHERVQSCIQNIVDAAREQNRTIDLVLLLNENVSDGTQDASHNHAVSPVIHITKQLTETLTRPFDIEDGVINVVHTEIPMPSTSNYNNILVWPMFAQTDSSQEIGGRSRLVSFDATMDERIQQSLCGTKEQVVAIWNAEKINTSHSNKGRERPTQNEESQEKGGEDKNPQMIVVAPMGTTLSLHTDLQKDIFPHLVHHYNDTEFVRFHKDTSMSIDPGEKNTTYTTAGGAFWVSMNGDEKTIDSKAAVLQKTFMDQYTYARQVNLDALSVVRATSNDQRQIIVDSRLPTWAATHPRCMLLEAQPAPRVFATYFPQYHKVAENDEFWGENFTEWTLLRNLTMDPPLKKPLPWDQGGLGYYNLEDYRVRNRQGEIAKKYGVQGFVYYHYWFSGGAKAPVGHKVMYKVLEQMLQDGAPDVEFMLSWANEPWSRRWSGGSNITIDDTLLLSQEYGEREGWREHFEYLLQFFQHPNYVRIDGRPVFIIYRLGHMGDKFEQMMKYWDELALQSGLPGLNIIQTIGGWYNVDKNTSAIAQSPYLDGSFHFYPSALKSEHAATGSLKDLSLDLPEDHIQYWGAYVGFDRRPRTPDTTYKFHLLRPTPQQCASGLQRSFESMSEYSNRRIGKNLFFLNAWNEYNEQAILEPTDLYGFQYLEGVSKNLRSLPLKRIDQPEGHSEDHRPHFVLHVGPSKTGTSSIQAAIKSCEEEIRKEGITVFEYPKPHMIHNFAYHMRNEAANYDYAKEQSLGVGHEHFLRNFDDELYSRTWDLIRQCEFQHDSPGEDRKPCTVLYSSEAMSYWDSTTWEFLLKRLAGWRVTFVMFHRLASESLRSNYVEMNKRWINRGIPDRFEVVASRSEVFASSTTALKTIVIAMETSSCGDSAVGPALCEIYGGSFDQMKQHSDHSLFDYLLLNATLRITGNSYTRAYDKYHKNVGESCITSEKVRASLPNAHLHVQFLNKVGDLYQQRNCTGPFDLYVEDERVQTALQNVSLPTKVWNINEEEVLEADQEWTRITGIPVKSSTEVETLDTAKLTDEHWKIANELLADICHEENTLVTFPAIKNSLVNVAT